MKVGHETLSWPVDRRVAPDEYVSQLFARASMNRDTTASEYSGEPVKYPSLRVIDLAKEAEAVTEDYRHMPR